MTGHTKIYADTLELLAPNDTLDVTLFDTRQILFPEIRRQLLNNAATIVDKCLIKIPQVTIDDVLMTAPCAGYFYHHDQAITLQILVNIKNSPCLSKDPVVFHRFMQTIIEGAFLDIKMQAGRYPVHFEAIAGITSENSLGLYSVLHNRWITPPDKNVFAGLSADEVIAAYRQKLAEIQEHFNDLCTKDKLQTSAGLNALEDYWHKIRRQPETPLDYLIRILLKNSRVFDDMRQVWLNKTKAFLSLPLPEEPALNYGFSLKV